MTIRTLGIISKTSRIEHILQVINEITLSEEKVSLTYQDNSFLISFLYFDQPITLQVEMVHTFKGFQGETTLLSLPYNDNSVEILSGIVHAFGGFMMERENETSWKTISLLRDPSFYDETNEPKERTNFNEYLYVTSMLVDIQKSWEEQYTFSKRLSVYFIIENLEKDYELFYFKWPERKNVFYSLLLSLVEKDVTDNEKHAAIQYLQTRLLQVS